jgi:uncharacterized repeat protein (TIGR03803 family)
MKVLRVGCIIGGLLSLALSLSAQTFTTLHSFDSSDGAAILAGLVQATDGNLYGTAYEGGANCAPDGCGTIFKITPSGTLTTLHSFCSQSNCTDGEYPEAGLIQATNGNFYGTTYQGGTNCAPDGCGTIFKITPSGTLTTLYNFCSQSGCSDGYYPEAGLIQASNGDFYGTTTSGGAGGAGTVFKITPGGQLTTLHSFCSQSNCTDGEYPETGLVQATNGNLFGTTYGGGGANGRGTIFKITPSGTLTTLYSFCSQSGCPDGGSPQAGLTQATNGNFYGTTFAGGAHDLGTVFKITLSGNLTTLHSFCSVGYPDCADGDLPRFGALVQATNGDLYGTAPSGGAQIYYGTIFKITPGGTLTTLYSFCPQSGCPDGDDPRGTLVQDTNGNLYGTTFAGGANGFGTVFSLSVGLGPFVETQTTSGKIGAAVKILGTNLTGATSVTFNGTTATFHVVSSSEITTAVPTGATTGKVKVFTHHGTLTSNVSFRVTP